MAAEHCLFHPQCGGQPTDRGGVDGHDALPVRDHDSAPVVAVACGETALPVFSVGQPTEKTGSVPVFLQPGEKPEDMFTSASYRPLVKVLEGLRAHDEEAVELLAIPQEPQKDVAQPSVNIGAAPEDGEEESRLLLRFAAPRDPVMVAEWVSFNVIDTERQDWARGYAALQCYVERVGNARVPYEHRKGATPLGRSPPQRRRVAIRILRRPHWTHPHATRGCNLQPPSPCSKGVASCVGADRHTRSKAHCQRSVRSTTPALVATAHRGLTPEAIPGRGQRSLLGLSLIHI